MTDTELYNIAVNAMKNSYAPYSGYNVGAALLCKNGKVYTGVNVENASYSVTCCAERSALFSAVSAGEREFLKIAVAGGKNFTDSGTAYPCGICRQALSELCGADFTVIVSENNSLKSIKLSELMPYGFTSGELEEKS